MSRATRSSRDDALKLAQSAGVKVQRGASEEEIRNAVRENDRQRWPHLAAIGDAEQAKNQ